MTRFLRKTLPIYFFASTTTNSIIRRLESCSKKALVVCGDNIIFTTPKTAGVVLLFVANHCLSQHNQLIELAASEQAQKETAVGVMLEYILTSHVTPNRLRITVQTPYYAPDFSCTSRFPSAGGLEREIYDLFGKYFTNNFDLRRILTDYGFIGHPLRKDFPLTGFAECVYDTAKGQILTQTTNLAQEFRIFKSARVNA